MTDLQFVVLSMTIAHNQARLASLDAKQKAVWEKLTEAAKAYNRATEAFEEAMKARDDWFAERALIDHDIFVAEEAMKALVDEHVEGMEKDLRLMTK
jgi:hypothetical protein